MVELHYFNGCSEFVVLPCGGPHFPSKYAPIPVEIPPNLLIDRCLTQTQRRKQSQAKHLRREIRVSLPAISDRMRALSSQCVLLDLQNSWHSANQIPISTLCYLQNSNFVSTVSSSFRRTRRGHKGIASSKHSSPSIPSPEIRRPSDRFFSGNGSSSNSPNSASTSQSEAASELGSFLELLPLRLKSELYRHEEIGKLIEVVMDLGRSPIARFPSGDWVISENPISHEDLRLAVSKVIIFLAIEVYIFHFLAMVNYCFFTFDRCPVSFFKQVGSFLYIQLECQFWTLL